VTVAASSGGLDALRAFVSRLPADFPGVILIVSHVAPGRKSALPMLLSSAGPLPAFNARDREPLVAGHIFVAPSGRHLCVRGDMLRLVSGAKENRVRPAADVLFRSAARAAGPLATGVVLSGTGVDGSQGLLAIHAAGGLTVVQAPEDAEFPAMPEHALAAAGADARLPASAIAEFVDRAARSRMRRATGQRRTRGGASRGTRVLLVEDEYLIAADVAGMLRALGCEVLGPAADVPRALALLRRTPEVDCAVLDVDLRGQPVFPLARVLRARGVPFVFATGYASTTFPPEWAASAHVEKPFDRRKLRAGLENARAVARAGAASPPRGGPPPPPVRRDELLKSARNGLMRASALLRQANTGVAGNQWPERTTEVVALAREALARSRDALADSARRNRTARHTLRSWPPHGPPRRGR
jgi:CheY-like chemotaxis protein